MHKNRTRAVFVQTEQIFGAFKIKVLIKVMNKKK